MMRRGLRRVLLDLAAEPADQHVDGPVERIPVAMADVIDEPVAGEDAPSIGDESGEEFEFGAGQAHLFALGRRQRPVWNIERPAVELLLGLVGRIRSRGGDAPGEILRPRQQLPHIVGLRHVVVGAELEGDDAVDDVLPPGHHDDPDLRLTP